MPTPNTVLAMTEITATSMVRTNACTTSGCVRASTTGAIPPENVCQNTVASGRRTSTPT